MIEYEKHADGRLYSWHQLLFCLNLGFASALMLIVWELREQVGFVHGVAQSPNFFQRTLIGINLSVGRVPWDIFAIDVLLTATSILFVGVLLLILRFFSDTLRADILMSQIAGVTAVAAVPFSWVWYRPSSGTYSPANLGNWYLFILEFALIGGSLYLSRNKPSPTWFLILLAHYGFWGWVVWDRVKWGFSLASYWPLLLSLLAPLSGIVWAAYFGNKRDQHFRSV